MKEHFPFLLSSAEALPTYESCSSYSQINAILSQYISVLNFANSYSDDYKRATNIYYTDISNIRDNIQRSLYATSYDEKKMAFEDAKNELKADIKALAILCKAQEEA
jgi:hypothetical protein